jgi:hypothetical protein
MSAKLEAEIQASLAAAVAQSGSAENRSRGARSSVVMSFAPPPNEGGPQLYLMTQDNGTTVPVCEDGNGGWLAFPVVNTSVGQCANHPTGLVPLNTLQTLLPSN